MSKNINKTEKKMLEKEFLSLKEIDIRDDKTQKDPSSSKE